MTPPNPRNPEIFISYSRKNTDITMRVVEALKNTGRDVWIDIEDIPPSADWWNWIKAGIDNAHTFVSIVTPEMLISPPCIFEQDYALQNNKRIIVVMVGKPSDIAHVFGSIAAMKLVGYLAVLLGDKDLLVLARDNWRFIEKFGWVWMGESDDFDKAIEELTTALDQDLDRHRLHTRLLNRVRAWLERDHDPSFLLRDTELDEAVVWLTQHGDEKPKATPDQRAFIAASEEMQAAGVAREARTRRNLAQARFGVVLAIALITVIGLAFLLVQNQTQQERLIEGANSNATLAAAGDALAAQGTSVALERDRADAGATSVAQERDRADAGATSVAQQAATATHAQGAAEANLRAARDSQALFTADLSRQQLEEGHYQNALLLANESVTHYDEGIYHPESMTALVKALDAPAQEVLHVRNDETIVGAAWNADETRLLTWSADNTARVWSTDFEYYRALGQQRAIREFIPAERARFFLP